MLKCLHKLVTRDGGIDAFGLQITAVVIDQHLRQNGVADNTIDRLLNPTDKQDVMLAHALLKALRELPDAPLDSTPTFRRTRRVLRAFGNLSLGSEGEVE